MVIDMNGVNSLQNQSSRSSATSNRSDGGNGKASAKADAVGSDDQVQLSSQANALQKVEARIQDLPDVDSERVAALRQQIENGEYQVNADNIAQKLIDESLS